MLRRGRAVAVSETDTGKCTPGERPFMTADHLEPSVPAGERETAPQSPYDRSQGAVGVVGLAVGLALTFGLAYVLV
jgi:hypothetical protein